MKFSTVSSIAMSLALANACLLAAVAQVSKEAECKSGLHDFSCICESNGSTVISTLNSICPNGDADTAVSAFKAQCGEQGHSIKAASSTKTSSAKTSTSTAAASSSAAASTTKASSAAASSDAESSAAKSSAAASSDAKSSAAASSDAESSAAASSAAASSDAESSAAASSAAESSAAASSAAPSAPLSHSHASSAGISTSVVAIGGSAQSTGSSLAPVATAPSDSATTIEQTNGGNAAAIPFIGAIMAGAAYLF
ncbi:hypothetical protein DV454_004163 [Geotrichum candidum]|nr:hypothetical protein DV454_004163 [Geotrichum candidum]